MTRSLSGQQIASDLAGSINQQLQAALMTRAVEEVFVATHTQSKFVKRGLPYLIQVISAIRERGEKTGEGKLGEDETKQKIIGWLSHEISTRVSNGVVDFTVKKITSSYPQDSEPHEGEATVDSSLTVNLPTWSERVRFVVMFKGAEVARVDSVEVKVTGQFNGEVVVRLQRGPTHVQSVEFKDCGLKLSASLPWGKPLSFNVPIRGDLTV